MKNHMIVYEDRQFYQFSKCFYSNLYFGKIAICWNL